MYRCAACDLAVIVRDDALIRGCSCDAAVIADMASSLQGSSRVN